MSKIKIFLILSGYQLTWLSCVFGELLYNSWSPGLFCGLVFVFICFLNTPNRKKFLITVLSFSLIGYFFDSVMIFFEIYKFHTSLYFGLLPVWMLILWPSFSSLFDEVFVFLSEYKMLAILLGGILGPITYFSGEPLGLITINNTYLFFILMPIFWAILMMIYVFFLVNLKSK